MRTVHDINKIGKLINVITTRRSNVLSAIRSSIYKQGVRNIVENVLHGNGYEGIIEIYEKN